MLIAFQGAPHIFNLGHGITPDATPENVAELVQAGERRHERRSARRRRPPRRGRRPGLRVMTSRRVAIILFNLGGPDSPEAVRPFLFNLFNDPAIIGAPQPFRFLLAQLISRSREKPAKANYAHDGRRLADPAGNAKAGRRARSRDRQARQQRDVQVLSGDALLAPVREGAASAAEAIGTQRTRSCCRSIRSTQPPRQPPRSKAWKQASATCPPRRFAAIPPAQKFAEAHAEAILESVARRRLAGETARALLRARLAAERRRSRRSLSVAGRAKRRRRAQTAAGGMGDRASATSRASAR